MPFLIELRPGQGGDDATDFADLFASSIEAWARTNNAACFRTSDEPGAPVTRAINLIMDGVDSGELWWLSGTHRRQSVPGRGKGKGGRQTSYMTVRVLDAAPGGGLPDIPRHELKIVTRRGTGPGGQHVNTTNSCVDVTDLVTGEVASRSHGRSQAQNIQGAVMDLRRRRADRAAAQNAAARNAARAVQSDPVVVFNHNRMRREVEHKPTGHRWEERAWQRGEFSAADLPAALAR